MGLDYFKGKKVLVTGGAGAIGSSLSRQLLKHGADVVVIDDLSSGFEDNVPKGAKFIKGCITDEKLLGKLFKEGISVVFHLAANFANQNSVDHPVRDLEVNGKGTLLLLDMALKQGVERFVFASSSCVYGNQAKQLEESDAKIELDTPYAVTKLLGEQYVNFYHDFHGLKTVILRYFNSYGPGEKPGKYRNVIPNFLELAMKGKPLPITGTGDETRDFTFVDDITHGTLLAASSDAAIGGTFNLGSGKETKIIKIAEIINEATGNKAGIEIKERRKWDTITRRWANVSQAKKTFSYEPHTELEEGIFTTVEWFKTL